MLYFLLCIDVFVSEREISIRITEGIYVTFRFSRFYQLLHLKKKNFTEIDIWIWLKIMQIHHSSIRWYRIHMMTSRQSSLKTIIYKRKKSGMLCDESKKCSMRGGDWSLNESAALECLPVFSSSFHQTYVSLLYLIYLKKDIKFQHYSTWNTGQIHLEFISYSQQFLLMQPPKRF